VPAFSSAGRCLLHALLLLGGTALLALVLALLKLFTPALLTLLTRLLVARSLTRLYES
jgi:hypothetical protein